MEHIVKFSENIYNIEYFRYLKIYENKYLRCKLNSKIHINNIDY